MGHKNVHQEKEVIGCVSCFWQAKKRQIAFNDMEITAGLDESCFSGSVELKPDLSGFKRVWVEKI